MRPIITLLVQDQSAVYYFRGYGFSARRLARAKIRLRAIRRAWTIPVECSLTMGATQILCTGDSI